MKNLEQAQYNYRTARHGMKRYYLKKLRQIMNEQLKAEIETEHTRDTVTGAPV